MKIPIPLQLAVLAVAMTGFYTMVGQAVPQKEVHPPEVIEIAADISTAELVEIGKGIFEGKGICVTCHTIGKSGALRFPDLDGVAVRATNRIAGYTALDYFAETLYEPNAFVVDGFNPGMPAANKPPVGLTDQEILAVIAFLQTLGGEPSVTLDTKLAYTGGSRESEAAAVVADAGDAGDPEASAAAASTPLGTYGCTRCHGPERDPAAPAGPDLDGYGARHGADEIVVKLTRHPADDRLLAMTLAELDALVAYLSAPGDAG